MHVMKVLAAATGRAPSRVNKRACANLKLARRSFSIALQAYLADTPTPTADIHVKLYSSA
jgi:hypothetical protein